MRGLLSSLPFLKGTRASGDSSSHLALWSPECIWSHPLHHRARRRPPPCIRANPPGREPPSYSAKGLCSPRWQGWAQGAPSEGVSFAPSWNRRAERPLTGQSVCCLTTSKTLTDTDLVSVSVNTKWLGMDWKQRTHQDTAISETLTNECHVWLHLLVLSYILYGKSLCRVVLKHS